MVLILPVLHFPLSNRSCSVEFTDRATGAGDHGVGLVSYSGHFSVFHCSALEMGHLSREYSS